MEKMCRVSIDGNCFDENYTFARGPRVRQQSMQHAVSTIHEWKKSEYRLSRVACSRVLTAYCGGGEFTQPTRSLKILSLFLARSRPALWNMLVYRSTCMRHGIL